MTYLQGQAVHCLTLITKALYSSEHRQLFIFQHGEIFKKTTPLSELLTSYFTDLFDFFMVEDELPSI